MNDPEQKIVELTRDERDIVRGLLLAVRHPRKRGREWTPEEERLLAKLQDSGR